MSKATRAVATWFGVLTGLAGLEHGVSEALRGDTAPEGLVFPSMGPPCDPARAWHVCEPAMSVVPSFLISGLLTIVLSALILVWSMTRMKLRRGGLGLGILSISLLLVGGGFFPPLIGLVGGLAGSQAERSAGGRQPARFWTLTAGMWPWPLVAFVAWTLGQFVVGYLFNDGLKSLMGYGVLLILMLMLLSLVAALAADARTVDDDQQNHREALT
ncbi:MAG: hypothetical protein JNL73_10515 [Anaerolineales bacterium]|nr:hypothetical protein [Anaerolineales bacterium]